MIWVLLILSLITSGDTAVNHSTNSYIMISTLLIATALVCYLNKRFYFSQEA